MKAALDMPTADARSVERDVERKLLELEAERACLCLYACGSPPTTNAEGWQPVSAGMAPSANPLVCTVIMLLLKKTAL